MSTSEFTQLADIVEKVAEKNIILEDRCRDLEQRVAEGHHNYKTQPLTTKGAKQLLLNNGSKAWMLPNDVKATSVMESSSGIDVGRAFHAMLSPQTCKDSAALDLVKSTTTGSTGVPIPTDVQGQWIDLLRSHSVLQKAGVWTVPMVAKSMSWGAVTGDPTPSWHAEATADISASDPTLAARTLTAKTITVRTTVSLEVTEDSPAFGFQLADVMARAIAAEIDRAGLEGASNGPTGLAATAGIGEVSSVATPTDYSEMLSGLKTLLDANNDLSAVDKYAIMSPRTWLTYAGLKTGISSDNTPLVRPKALEMMEFLTTTNVSNTYGGLSPATDSNIYLGDFTQMVMGLRSDFQFDILKVDNYASSLLLEVVAYSRLDFVVQRPASFCKLTSVTA